MAAACGDVGSDVYLGERPEADRVAVRLPPVIGHAPERTESQDETDEPSTPLSDPAEPEPVALPNLVLVDVDAPRWAAPGQRVPLRYTVENQGEAPAPAVSIRFELVGEPSFEWMSAMLPALPPGASHTVEQTIEVRASLPPARYVLNGQVDPDRWVTETHEGDNRWFGQHLHVSRVLVEPAELEFPPVAPGCSHVETVTFRNLGDASVRVAEFGFEASPTAGEFSVVGPGFPLHLEPGRTASVEVRFRPNYVASHHTQLRWRGEHHREPFFLPVFASSEQFPFRTDRHLQGPAQIDVLLVVDDGPGMAEEHAELRPHLQQMLDQLQGRPADIRVAVAGSDPRKGLAGPPVDGRNPSAFAKLQLLASPPVRPGGGAQLLEAAVAAVETKNGGGAWLRPGAALLIVLVSNRDDRSTGAPEDFVARLAEARDDPSFDRTAANGIILDGSPRCGGAASPRLARFVSALAGHLDPVCDADQFDALWWLPHARFGLDRRFELSSPMLPRTLAVRVDGRGVPALGAGPRGRSVPQWRIERGAVLFEPRRQPLAGARVELEYVPDCRPF
ncbi:MAG TPA: CARDB domain-containing protein [Myxococcales bacterium LLY-WYZ-16_1]|nr:CARDB domain-containing protein [Myxococcales bacterium LLY-WYZ-16_1]